MCTLLRIAGLLYLLTLCASCGIVEPQQSAPEPTIAPMQTRTDIAELLHGPRPAPGTVVEIDAYTSVVMGMSRPSGAQNSPCLMLGLLTDQPYRPVLRILDSIMMRVPAPDDPLLFLASKAALSTPIPYHVRLRGHLDDPSVTGCPMAERIFVLDQVVTIYTQDAAVDLMPTPEIPAQFDSWLSAGGEAFGFRVRYPPDWVLTESRPGELVLTAPAPVQARITARARQGAWPIQAALRQGYYYGRPLLDQPLLPILEESCPQDREQAPEIQIRRLVLSDAHASLLLILHIPVGMSTPQERLDEISTIVESAALAPFSAAAPTATRDSGVEPTPTSPPSAADMMPPRHTAEEQSWLCEP